MKSALLERSKFFEGLSHEKERRIVLLFVPLERFHKLEEGAQSLVNQRLFRLVEAIPAALVAARIGIAEYGATSDEGLVALAGWAEGVLRDDPDIKAAVAELKYGSGLQTFEVLELGAVEEAKNRPDRLVFYLDVGTLRVMPYEC